MQDAERSLYDLREVGCVIEVELQYITKSVPQWTREAREFRRRTDEGELRDIHLYARGSGTRTDHDIDLEVFHRGVEDLLDLGFEPVYLIDKEDLSLDQTREQ